jgi:predicted RNA binding protein YcfA (HicA-like mRNA interferase family)
MTRIAKLYAQIRLGSRPSFKELCKVAEAFGFALKRVAGCHYIFQHPGIPGNLNLQSDGKDSKPYQVRQLLDMIETYGLEMSDE